MTCGMRATQGLSGPPGPQKLRTIVVAVLKATLGLFVFIGQVSCVAVVLLKIANLHTATRRQRSTIKQSGPGGGSINGVEGP